MYLLNEQKCPYCNIPLPTIPKRKTKCKSCNNYYYVKTRVLDREKVIVTEKERNEIEAEWQKHFINNARCPSDLISEDEFQEAKKLVLSKGGNLNINDITWGLLNKTVLSEMQQGNWHRMSRIYYEMAMFAARERRDVFHILQEATRCKLMDYKREGVNQVKILTAGQDSCSVCNQQNGKIFTIDEALKMMPIPVKECSTEVFVDGKGFCRCLYLASGN